ERADEVVVPDRPAGRRVEAAQVADRPERVDAAIRDGWGGPRAVVVPAERAVLRRVGVLPDDPAVGSVEAHDALDPVGVGAARLRLAVECVHPAAGGTQPGVAAADPLGPDALRPAGRPALRELRGLPGAVAAR